MCKKFKVYIIVYTWNVYSIHEKKTAFTGLLNWECLSHFFLNKTLYICKSKSLLYLYVINLQELATSNYFYIIRLICIWNPLNAACPVKKIDRRRHNIIDLVFWRKFIYNKTWRKATKSNNKTANPRKKTHINKLNEQEHLSRQKRKKQLSWIFLRD